MNGDFSNEMLNEPFEFESPKPTAGGLVASVLALEQIKRRSFSGRHPELGKMVKCQVCQKRHRDSIKCEQKFVYLHTEEDLETGEVTDVYRTSGNTRNGVAGAQRFKGKRLKPHASRRMKQFVQLVRDLLPDEYTEEDLTKARKKATRMLVEKFGRFNLVPRQSASQKSKAGA